MGAGTEPGEQDSGCGTARGAEGCALELAGEPGDLVAQKRGVRREIGRGSCGDGAQARAESGDVGVGDDFSGGDVGDCGGDFGLEGVFQRNGLWGVLGQCFEELFEILECSECFCANGAFGVFSSGDHGGMVSGVLLGLCVDFSHVDAAIEELLEHAVADFELLHILDGADGVDALEWDCFLEGLFDGVEIESPAALLDPFDDGDELGELAHMAELRRLFGELAVSEFEALAEEIGVWVVCALDVAEAHSGVWVWDHDAGVDAHRDVLEVQGVSLFFELELVCDDPLAVVCGFLEVVFAQFPSKELLFDALAAHVAG
eukprot:comp22016_c0_seq1/m.50629 comp22016_c0_seq1/g.50629  ORF comp22016_c0_seq1/g.50629 comp22016_c0_seq1/m.50629 type:complete len:317 (-) comp22016_c0_seq1:476-1426(-)